MTAKVLAVAIAIKETIQELGEAPAGHLYAAVMGVVSLDEFEAIVGALVERGLVERKPSHLLVWKGEPCVTSK